MKKQTKIGLLLAFLIVMGICGYLVFHHFEEVSDEDTEVTVYVTLNEVSGNILAMSVYQGVKSENYAFTDILADKDAFFAQLSDEYIEEEYVPEELLRQYMRFVDEMDFFDDNYLSVHKESCALHIQPDQTIQDFISMVDEKEIILPDGSAVIIHRKDTSALDSFYPVRSVICSLTASILQVDGYDFPMGYETVYSFCRRLGLIVQKEEDKDWLKPAETCTFEARDSYGSHYTLVALNNYIGEILPEYGILQSVKIHCDNPGLLKLGINYHEPENLLNLDREEFLRDVGYNCTVEEVSLLYEEDREKLMVSFSEEGVSDTLFFECIPQIYTEDDTIYWSGDRLNVLDAFWMDFSKLTRLDDRHFYAADNVDVAVENVWNSPIILVYFRGESNDLAVYQYSFMEGNSSAGFKRVNLSKGWMCVHGGYWAFPTYGLNETDKKEYERISDAYERNPLITVSVIR